MYESGHLAGGAAVLQKYKLGAAMANAGVIAIGGAGTSLGVIPCTTTSFDAAFGLSVDQATYTTTQATIDTNAGDSLVTVSKRPDLIIGALMSGGATEGTVLVTLSNTSASAGGTVVSDTDVAANDMDGGIIWCISGANVGQSRGITSMTASVSATVTVPFPRAIAVGDTFLMAPYNTAGTGAAGADGPGWVQTSTLFTQADATIASGTGGESVVHDLILRGASDSYVLFTLRLHAHNSASMAA